MDSDSIRWDVFDQRIAWILRAAAGGGTADSVSIEVLRSISPTMILGVHSVGLKRGKLAWEALQAVIGSPGNTFDCANGLQRPWEVFSPETRRVVRAALRAKREAPASGDSLRRLTLHDLLSVRSHDHKHRLRAWTELQDLISTNAIAGSNATSHPTRRDFLPIPALPAEVEPRDLIHADALGTSAARMIEALFAQRDRPLPARLSLRWLRSLDQIALQSIAHVGTLRASQFIERVADYEQSRELPTDSARELGAALAHAHPRVEHAIAALMPRPELLAGEFGKLYETVTSRAAQANRPLGWLLIASAHQLSDATGISGPEADAFVSGRDDWFSHRLIARAVNSGAEPNALRIAVMLRVAMQSSVQWTSATWELEAGVAIGAFARTARVLLGDTSFAEWPEEWAYVEGVEMQDEVLAGATLTTVGERRGMTREAVRQRVLRLGYRQREYKAAKRRRRATRDEQISNNVEAYVRSHPGCTPLEVSNALGIAIGCATRECERLDWLTISDAGHNEPQSVSSARLLTASRTKAVLQVAATLAFPVTKLSYDELRDRGFISGPSSARVLQIFGSWRRACHEAGIEPGESPRSAGQNLKWSRLELLDVVLRYLVAPEFRGQAQQYSLWRHSQPVGGDLPSFSTIQNNLGMPWSQVRVMALRRARRLWECPTRLDKKAASGP